MLARTHILAPTLVALGAIAGCSTPPSSTHASSKGAPASTATQESLVPLTRNLHPFATKEADVGHRDPSIVTAGSIYFKLSDAQRADRDALLAAVQNPASPSYHKWLTVEQYAARFGAKKADIDRMSGWLQSQGLAIDSVSRTGSRIGFRAPGGQIEAAFHTQLDNFDVDGERHYAMATAPMVPRDLAPLVLGLHGFHNFHPSHPLLRRPVRPNGADPTFGGLALAPPDFEVLYNTAPLTAAGTTGQGVNLVIVGQTYITPSDLASFRTKYNLNVHEVDVLVPNTGTQAINDTGDEGESELDLEWSGAVAPGANIIFVYTGNSGDFSVDDAAAYAIEEGEHLVPGTGNGAAQLISESYGGCDVAEEGTNADVDSEIAAAANLQGITYLASSGDSGATACSRRKTPGSGGLHTALPAGLPGITAVGGTEFCGGTFKGGPAGCFYTSTPAFNVQTTPWFANNNAVEYPVSPGGEALEGVWNDSTIADGPGGGGGGQSAVFPKPAYQQGVAGMLNDGTRDVPDVSLTASATNLGYLVWEPNLNPDGGADVDELAAIGGTSASSPSFAGILARVNQAVAAHGGALGLGNVNPQLYTLFANNGQLGAFHDIVLGDNKVPCDPTNQTSYPGCPMPAGGLPAGTDGGVLPDGGAASTYGWSAQPGYDMATGLGTVDADKLVNAWVSLTPTTTALAAPTTATAGTPVTLTATITSTAASATTAVGGTVTFAFYTLLGPDAGAPYSFDAGGGPDESWVLGTVNVTAGTGSPSTATATLSTAIPPGLFGQAYLVAEYSGDLHYLASKSSQSPAAVTGSNLAIAPVTINLAPNAQTTIAATGGVPPVTWVVGSDTSCLISGHRAICSALAQTSPTSAILQAGGQDGVATILAIDSAGEEAFATVNVTGTAIEAGALDAGTMTGGPSNPPIPYWDGGEPTVDGGTLGFPDAGADEDATAPGGGPTTTPVDSGAPNGATSGGGSNSSSGCGCVVAGGSSSESTGASAGGLLLGLAFLRRRRSKRA